MQFIEYISNIDQNYYLIVLLALFFTLEQITDNPFSYSKRLRHLLQNMLFFLVLFVLNLIVFKYQIQLIEWFNAHETGLLFLFDLPFWIKLTVSVVLYDFVTYWIHRASHKIPLLWRLHQVHHSDTSMDASTSFRFHPLEPILVYQMGNVITVGLFGTDITSLAIYYLMVYLFFFIEHSNLKYPSWMNSTLGLLFVMPAHHRVHHHREQEYTDSNFADIFIIWDRIFGTFKMLDTQSLQYGLHEFDSEEKQGFIYQMKSPFIESIKNHN